jgi:large subunit ribosomal protein L37Ae
MSKRTKKVGRTGWMGARYGIKVRRRVLEVDRARDVEYACPKCSTQTLRRVASGIYRCRRCSTTFASDAYVFRPAPALTRAEGEAEGPPSPGADRATPGPPRRAAGEGNR